MGAKEIEENEKTEAVVATLSGYLTLGKDSCVGHKLIATRLGEGKLEG